MILVRIITDIIELLTTYGCQNPSQLLKALFIMGYMLAYDPIKKMKALALL